MSKVAILGAGIMASALTFPLAENGHEVCLVGTHLDREIVDSIQKTGVHPDLDLKLHDRVTAYQLEDAKEAFDGADVAMSGVNSFGVQWVAEQLKDLIAPGMKFLSITKGLAADERGNLSIFPDVIRRAMPQELASSITFSAIVGPSIAGELAVHHDTCVIFCGEDQESLDFLSGLFSTDYYHIWTSTDFIGSEVGAAIKNVYAFAAGFAEGLLKKDGKENDRYRMYNYSAAVFAQGLSEMQFFFNFLGGNPNTTVGLAGVGDMFVTSMGGRNVKAGQLVGEGIPFSEIRDIHMKGVTMEGVAAIRTIGRALTPLTERGLISEDELPLLRRLHAIIDEDAALELPWDSFFGGRQHGKSSTGHN